MLSKVPAKAREEHERVSKELSQQHDDWVNATHERANDELFKPHGDWRNIAALYSVRTSPAYADLDSCVLHAYRAARSYGSGLSAR